jgi:hypothetical protein
MTDHNFGTSVEAQIDQWRNYLHRRQAIHSVDVVELEDHLREQISGLVGGGLASDEAFLVAIKRMGDLNAVAREFAVEHSERLWKQLVVLPPESGETAVRSRTEAGLAFGFAAGAALLVKLPELFGKELERDADFYLRNVAFFVLPLLTGYFVWKRRVHARMIGALVVAFVVAMIFANIYPFATQGNTLALTALHLPIALWLVMGVAYAGTRWKEVSGRMDFVRFSGELLIYYVLIALGGGALTAFTFMIFEAIGIKIEMFWGHWIIPCGAAAAVIIAAWLVEAKQSVIENMAPVLTRLFTPLFAIALLMFLGALIFTGRGVGVDRNVLIAFDALLVIVLALLLYSVSARDPGAPHNAFDVLQVVLVISALLADAAALWAIAQRINDLGSTPNRVAALGENVILLVNLAWSAGLYIRFLRGRGSFAALEKWQTDYLPVYAAWAAIVVIVFPPLFGYI